MKFQTKYQISEYINKPIYYLTPIGISKNNAKDGSVQWIFRCICGKDIETTPYRVISGHNKSCGCMRYKKIIRKEQSRENSTKVNPEEYMGKRNNKLTVIGYEKPKEKGRLKLKCRCDCGNITYVYPYQFTNGKVKSCGCLKLKTKHGLYHHPLYKVWQKIKTRCYNKQDDRYKNYGGRGIKVCKEWQEFVPFFNWAIANGYREDLTIERINVNGDYCPENCKWITMKEQYKNKTTTRFFSINGETHCLTDWVKIFNQNYKLVSNRLSLGWPIEKALTTSVKHKNKEE